MTGHADIPLHTAAEPGTPQSQIARPENRIAADQIPSCCLVIKRPEPAAKARYKLRPEPIIFQYRCFQRHWLQCPVIPILHLIGQNIAQPSIPHKEPVIFIQTGFQAGIRPIAHGGQRADAAQMSTSHCLLFKPKCCHDSDLFSLR